jgi:uncharacterized protein YcbK (DUF882 family)
MRHFAPHEFDYFPRMDEDLLEHIDELRERCGFPLVITSDHREPRDMEAIYGRDRDEWPNSAHQRGHAVDLQPLPNTQHNRLRLAHEASGMHLEGRWPRLGLEIAGRHIHVDNDVENTRPFLWAGKSF